MCVRFLLRVSWLSCREACEDIEGASWHASSLLVRIWIGPPPPTPLLSPWTDNVCAVGLINRADISRHVEVFNLFLNVLPTEVWTVYVKMGHIYMSMTFTVGMQKWLNHLQATNIITKHKPIFTSLKKTIAFSIHPDAAHGVMVQ